LVTEKDNLTLSCLVSQRKRSSSVLILRWFFTPPTQFLIVKMGIKRMKFYGNYTRRFAQPKFCLLEETDGEVYRLQILSVMDVDQGFYTCRVQEIRKYRNIWRTSSNGTSTTQLTGCNLTVFSDVYLCAVLICSLGLLSIFLFTLFLIFQYFYRRHRLKASYLLVKCPESRGINLCCHGQLLFCICFNPSCPPHSFPFIPQSGTLQEDSLTYAELELVRPRHEPPASSSPEPTASSSDTVYAQILFQENQL
uniref:V-set and transmembrane domain containing 4a n=1 Tax=Gouania willdenowi TaxID=441366 RepID=A0A8C5H3N5_GOUWI